MRLINTHTKRLEEFPHDNNPRYAILSHTWGENEVSFKDICDTGYISGTSKIDGCISQVIKDGVVDYVWIDTCCIDKSSSTELSEAINSMWKYYAYSQDCYVYLSDLDPGDAIDAEGSQFRESRWFKRGWTLQELIAPESLKFYNSEWQCVGKTGYYQYRYPEGRQFMELVSAIARIPLGMLWWHHADKVKTLRTYSVAQKMSWAAGRRTTKVEDQAYCLFGLFGVNMGLLYGEGAAAFQRLQMKIIKLSDDESIFAWAEGNLCSPCRLLASSPGEFNSDIISHTLPGFDHSHYIMTNKGLRISMEVIELFIGGGAFIGRLNSTYVAAKDTKSVVLPLNRSVSRRHTYSRAMSFLPIMVTSSLFSGLSGQPIYLHKTIPDVLVQRSCGLQIQRQFQGNSAFSATEIYPPSWANALENGYIRIERAHLERNQAYAPHPTLQTKSFLVSMQKIYIACRYLDGRSFLVRLDYTFTLFKNNNPEKASSQDDHLQPTDLTFAATAEGGRESLAELLIVHREDIDTIFKWEERLELQNNIISFELHKYASYHLNVNSRAM